MRIVAGTAGTPEEPPQNYTLKTPFPFASQWGTILMSAYLYHIYTYGIVISIKTVEYEYWIFQKKFRYQINESIKFTPNELKIGRKKTWTLELFYIQYIWKAYLMWIVLGDFDNETLKGWTVPTFSKYFKWTLGGKFYDVAWWQVLGKTRGIGKIRSENPRVSQKFISAWPWA